MIETILPHELPRALERAPTGVKVLSLDCFDTLLWRDCHAPTDLFAGLSGLTVAQRVRAETQARKAQTILHRRSEVALNEIYAQAIPNADSGALSIDLPLAFPAEIPAPQPNLLVTVSDIEDINGSTSLSGPNVTNLLTNFSVVDNLDSFRGGWDELWASLDTFINDTVLSRPLPVIGTQLAGAIDFIGQIRSKMSDNLALITDTLTAGDIEQALFDAFGPGGLNWLQTSSGGAPSLDDINVTINAEEVTIESLPTSENQRRQIGSIVATGDPAEVIQHLPEQQAQITASGGVIEYGIDDGVILLRENASIDRLGNRVSGNRIEYHLGEELIKAKANPNTRVHTVFDPSEAIGAGSDEAAAEEPRDQP